MTPCDAAIRPFPDDTEMHCERDPGHEGMHQAILRDYAWPGSETVVEWAEDDRRNFRGGWPGRCSDAPCTLPAGHQRGHAP